MISAYLYALYKDKNRQTPFEFMTGNSPAVIPNGTVVPEGAVIPRGAVIPEGTVLPVGSIIPPGTVIPAGAVFEGKFYNPKKDKFDTNMVKIPLGAQVPNGAVIPVNAFIPLNTYLPEGKPVVVPANAVIPKGSIIKSGTVVPNASVISSGTVIPENKTSVIEIPLGTIIPSGTVVPKGIRIPKAFTPTSDITTVDQLRTQYLQANPNASDLVTEAGTINIPNGKKICIPTTATLPDNMSGMVITEGTVIPKTTGINVPLGTVITSNDAVEPLDWNASVLSRYAHLLKPMGVWGWIGFILDVIILYYAISIALCASPKPSTVALHLILALLFAPFYVLYHVLFNSQTYQRYRMMESFLGGDSDISRVSGVAGVAVLASGKRKSSKLSKSPIKSVSGKRFLISRSME